MPPPEDPAEADEEQVAAARPWWLFPLVAFLAALSLGLAAWRDTMAPPAVHSVTVELPGVAEGSTPITIALLSDIHGAWPTMTRSRISAIVAEVNALQPDVVAIAGDFVAKSGPGIVPNPVADVVGPLRELHAHEGVFAVIGNNDFGPAGESVGEALERAGVILLRNGARRVGPVALGGLDGEYIRPGRVEDLVQEMEPLGGGKVILAHVPDDFSALPPRGILMLTGHTHCGQVSFFGWAPITFSRFGQRYACGLVREEGNVLVVTAGLGTSIAGFRLGAPPDLWLVTIRSAGSVPLANGRAFTVR